VLFFVGYRLRHQHWDQPRAQLVPQRAVAVRSYGESARPDGGRANTKTRPILPGERRRCSRWIRARISASPYYDACQTEVTMRRHVEIYALSSYNPPRRRTTPASGGNCIVPIRARCPGSVRRSRTESCYQRPAR